jgi:hypothetical protein
MNQRQRLLEQIRQQSIQKRAQALKEAAQRQANNAPIAAAAGAAGGGGGSAQCPPSAGIGLYLEFPLFDDIFGVGIIPQDYLGQQDGKPSYGGSIVPGEFESRLQFDPETGQWRGDFTNGPDTFSTYSDQLVSSDWSEFNIPDIPIQVQQTTCGFPDLGRYCITFPAFGVQAQPFPAWFGSEPEGLADFWQLGFGIIGWLPALDPEAPAGWLVSVEDTDDFFIPGGSQDQLPLGEFEIATGFTMIIAEGACDF